MENQVKFSQFLDGEGRITQLPRKQKVRLAVLAYLAEKFERERDYTESEVNAVCARWHTFDDYFLLRRELVESHMMARERNGSRYWRPPAETASEAGAEASGETAASNPEADAAKRI